MSKLLKTITDKAEIAISALDGAALEMFRQMKTGEIDRPAADKLIKPAQRKARAAHNAYFARKDGPDHLEQMKAFRASGLDDKLRAANTRFNRVLKNYAERIGARVETSAAAAKALKMIPGEGGIYELAAGAPSGGQGI